jgi:hypothetical protein
MCVQGDVQQLDSEPKLLDGGDAAELLGPQWSWCTVDGPLPLGQGMQWADKQPDNAQGNEGCVHLRVYKNGSLPALSDRNCSQKYFLACKVPILIKICILELTLLYLQGTPTLSSVNNKAACPGSCIKDVLHYLDFHEFVFNLKMFQEKLFANNAIKS